MAYDTRELAVKITGDSTQFKKATSDVTKQSENAKSSLESFADGAKKTSVAFGVVGAGLTLYAKSATDYTKQQVSNAKELSRETGSTIEDSSRLLYATQRLGISADQASAVFGIFSKNIKAAGDASDPASTKLGAIGVQVKDAEGKTRSFNDILLDTADKFKGMKDGSEKTATAMELFGKSGKDMLPVLNKGSEGIRELEKKADDLGLTLNSKTVGAIAKYTQSQKDLADSTNALKLQVGSLTAPVLTRFNTEMNHTITSLLNSSPAVRTVTANILAFGGPVAGAASALVGFAANVATTIEALGGLRAAYAVTTAFIAGPWGMALVAAGAIVGALTLKFLNHQQQTEQTKSATDRLRESTDALSAAQELARGKSLDLEGANLRVEQAQNIYNEAVRNYGPLSLEARTASHDLAVANNEQKQAANDAAGATRNLTKAQQENAKDKSIVDAANASANAIRDYVDQVIKANNTPFNPKTQSPSAKAGMNALDAIHQLGHNAGGTDNWRGGLTWVGEKGPEIVNLPKGSQVIPNDKSSQLSSGGNTSINITVNNGMYAGMPVEKRQIALSIWKELVRAARAQGVQLPNIGAISVQ